MRAIAALLLSLWLFDANAQAPNAWYTTTIKYVYAGQAGGRIALAPNQDINLGGCLPSGAPSKEFVIDPNNPYHKHMLMLVMTAYLTGKPVNLYTNGQCFGGGVLLTDVWLPM